MTNEITCSNVDVIELRSESDLTLETNTQIRFRTNNLMFDYIPFDEINDNKLIIIIYIIILNLLSLSIVCLLLCTP